MILEEGTSKEQAIERFCSRGILMDNEMEASKEAFIAYCTWRSPPLEITPDEGFEKDLIFQTKEESVPKVHNDWFQERLLASEIGKQKKKKADKSTLLIRLGE